jgi:hypothetical protein
MILVMTFSGSQPCARRRAGRELQRPWAKRSPDDSTGHGETEVPPCPVRTLRGPLRVELFVLFLDLLCLHVAFDQQLEAVVITGILLSDAIFASAAARDLQHNHRNRAALR